MNVQNWSSGGVLKKVTLENHKKSPLKHFTEIPIFA